MFEQFFFLLIMGASVTKGAIPGTFFWKPRLGLDLAAPTTESTLFVHSPTIENIREGVVVLVESYQAGLSIIAFASGLSNGPTNPHINLMAAHFYSESYRWALRYFSMIPFWVGGHGSHFCETLKTWRRRFYYMDELLPKWLRFMFPYVPKSSWEKEEWEMKNYKKYSESSFGKHYRYPTKRFRNFISFQTSESAEPIGLQTSLDRQ